jgi:hypothetical protein
VEIASPTLTLDSTERKMVIVQNDLCATVKADDHLFRLLRAFIFARKPSIRRVVKEQLARTIRAKIVRAFVVIVGLEA